MSEEPEVKPSCSKKLKSDDDVEDKLAEFQEAAEPPEELEGFVQDQMIVAPEIMRNILGWMDIRSLKQIRLVCKSWLLEAQHYMESRGTIVRLWSPLSSERITELAETRVSKIPTLPSPLLALDVDLYEYDYDYDQDVIPQMLLCLPPPLLITRFYPSQVRLGLVIRIVAEYASSLEYLCLYIKPEEDEDMPDMDPQQKFPKLRHLDVDFTNKFNSHHPPYLTHYPYVVPWIANAAPNLETYDFNAMYANHRDYVNALVMAVDIKNVKTFKFTGPSMGCLSQAALSHLMSIPFSRLQNFRFCLDDPDKEEMVWMSIVTRSFMTLKELELSRWLRDGARARVPVCPNVHSLGVHLFPFLKNYISTHFPSLETLAVNIFIEPQEEELVGLNDTDPLVGLKSLKIRDFVGAYPGSKIVQFFEKFPFLERLSMQNSALMYICKLISETSSSSNLLKSLKHLEIHDDINPWLCREVDEDDISYPALAILKGLESIIVTPSSLGMITKIPIKLFPRLKLIQFPWDDALNTEQNLLEMARGWEVKTILISNCCSILRGENPLTKALLTEFFEALPNAKCGCEHLRRRNSEWFW